MPGTAFSSASWSGYDEQSVTNPASSLTDFTLLIDVSTLSASWKATVQSDGADIRLTKGDGTTELAYDLINWAYNSGSPTGWIRVLWSGSLTSSGSQLVRVWAGYLSGTATSYDASETYGSDNAYDSFTSGYWPLFENPAGSAPQMLDRTSNGNDGTTAGTMTSGDSVSAKVGKGLDFDGTDDNVGITSATSLDLSSGEYAIEAWVNLAAAANQVTNVGIVAKGFNTTNDWAWRREGSSNTNIRMYHGGSSLVLTNLGSSVWGQGWVHLASTSQFDDVLCQMDTYLNGSLFIHGTLSTKPSHTSDPLNIGSLRGNGFFCEGIIDEVKISKTWRSSAWIAEEYAQSNDQSTFWGTWAWTLVNEGGGGSNIPAIMHHRRLMAC